MINYHLIFHFTYFKSKAVVDYVLSETNSSKLHYVGYSQGTTSFLTFLAEKPEYNDKIHAASLLVDFIRILCNF